MKKLVSLSVLLGVLIALVVQWNYNSECVSFHSDFALVTPNGVLCYKNGEYEELEQLIRDSGWHRKWPLYFQEKQTLADPRMKINFPTKQTMETHDLI